MRALLAVLALAAAVVAGGSGCGSGDDGATESGTTSTASSPSTSSSTSSTAPPSPSTTFSTAPSSTTLPAAAGDLEAKSGPARGTGVALLTQVRIGRHPGFDRVVFEFAGGNRPEWSVVYDPGPFSADGSGAPVPVRGEAFLLVHMQGGSGFNLDTGEQTYDGPDRLTAAGTAGLTEVVRTGDFEAVMGWVIGTDGRAPFRVTTLDAPSRLVVDVADQP